MTEHPPHLRAVPDDDPNPWQTERLAADANERANRTDTYTRGANLARNILRQLGLPEHGPNHQEKP